MNLRQSNRLLCHIIISAILAGSAMPLPSNAQEKADVIPDTPAGKRLMQVIECVSQPDKEKRDSLVVTLFTDDEDPEDLVHIASIVHKETGGIEFRELVESKEHRIVAVCAAKNGPFVKAHIDVTKTEDHLISNIFFGRHEEKKFAKRVGDLIPVLREDGTTFPDSRGVWLAEGYGYLAEVTSGNVKMYDYTGKYAWILEDEDEDYHDMYFKGGDSKDKARITFHPKEPGYNVVRLDSLPKACSEQIEWTPTKLFDLFADVMSTHYPFFEVRGVDWQARIQEHQPRVKDEMSETKLFDVMEAMLLDLNDSHTGLQAEIDGKSRRANTGRSLTVTRLKQAAKERPDSKLGKRVLHNFRNMVNEQVFDETLAGKGKKCCADAIMWGFATPDVGYIKIDGMGGYSLGNTDAQVAALHKSMNEILTALADTKAVVLDITLNGGGSDLFSLEIAAHFADQKRTGFSKWPASQEQYRNDRSVVPYRDTDAQGVMYLNPVYLMTSDFTVSAAEIFTMSMRAFPHVKTVGKHTCGALSDVLGKALPNGWEFHTSNEVYVDHEGISYEGKGIPPSVEMDVFDPDDILNLVHHETIAKVVNLALKDTAK